MEENLYRRGVGAAGAGPRSTSTYPPLRPPGLVSDVVATDERINASRGVGPHRRQATRSDVCGSRVEVGFRV
jgi:hypothetical protein